MMSQILTYVDDILIAAPTQEKFKGTTIALLKYLGEVGSKVSKNKCQLRTKTVKYLGYTLTEQGRVLDEDRKTANLPQPMMEKFYSFLLSWPSNFHSL